jgi:hypothetical protein
VQVDGDDPVELQLLQHLAAPGRCCMIWETMLKFLKYFRTKPKNGGFCSNWC